VSGLLRFAKQLVYKQVAYNTYARIVDKPADEHAVIFFNFFVHRLLGGSTFTCGKREGVTYVWLE